ncbi:UNVERIFIED_CONTAM: hypothetical protein FKN15_070813 [Acipenser sinensis]
MADAVCSTASGRHGSKATPGAGGCSNGTAPAPGDKPNSGPWENFEVRQLIRAWGDPGVQAQLNASLRNLRVYKHVSQVLKRVGIHRSPVQCREKAKKLKVEYKKWKSVANRRGDEKEDDDEEEEGASREPQRLRRGFRFYRAMDAVLGEQGQGEAGVASRSGAEEMSCGECGSQRLNTGLNWGYN